MKNEAKNILEKWVSIDEVSEHLGISKDTLRVYVKKEIMPFRRVGKQFRFRISEIDAWVESGEAAKIDVSRE